MKIGLMLSVAALGVAAVAVAAMPLQDAKAKSKPDDKAAAGAMDPKVMEAWAKAGAVGEQHTKLAKSAGTWNMVVKYWMPGMEKGPPMESKGTATREAILGGRFIVEKVKGDMGPMGAFEGFGVTGYNNITKQYDNVWTDSQGTGMSTSHGTAAADGTVTMTGDYDDPMGGKVKFRTVMKPISENEQLFEMYETMGSAPERKAMEISYKRG